MTIDITVKDPFFSNTADLIRNPYLYYEQIRKEGNVVWSSAGEERWIAVGYNAVYTCLTDSRFGVEASDAAMAHFSNFLQAPENRDLVTGLTKFILAQDPPQHTRVRKLINKAFTRAEVAGMTERLQGIVDGLLDRVVSKGKMDLIADFAFPMPMAVICGVLGFPETDSEQIKHWTEAIQPAVEPILTEGALETGSKAAKEMFDYFREQIQSRRVNPQDDLLSALVQAEEDGDTLTLDELMANLLLLLIAGHETTVNLVGNGMHALLENPDSMKKLRSNPDLIPVTIEEFLRFHSPLQVTDRYVKEDLELEGQRLKKGDRINVVLGAANRDPQQFENPDSLIIDRQPNKHLAFGMGTHFCVGAPLARIEGKLAFEELLNRLPNIALATDNVQYKPVTGFRGLVSLPITFDASSN